MPAPTRAAAMSGVHTLNQVDSNNLAVRFRATRSRLRLPCIPCRRAAPGIAVLRSRSALLTAPSAGVQWLDRGQHRLAKNSDRTTMHPPWPPRSLDKRRPRGGSPRGERRPSPAAQGPNAPAGLGSTDRFDRGRPCRLPGHPRTVSNGGANPAWLVGGGGLEPDGASGGGSNSVPSFPPRARSSFVPEEANFSHELPGQK